MKKIIAALFIVVLCVPARSQILIAVLFGEKLNTGKLEFGIVVTPSLTGFTSIESKRRNGLDLGIYFNIRPDRKFFFSVEGIAKGALGAKDIAPYSTGSDTLDHLFANGTVERKIKSFGLIALARYEIVPKFYAVAGIQSNMMLGAKDIFRAKVNDNDINYTIKINDQVTLLDFGLTGGVFYKFRKDKRSMGMGIRYFQGLTDILKSTPGTQANTAWQLNITIPIGAGKVNASSANGSAKNK